MSRRRRRVVHTIKLQGGDYLLAYVRNRASCTPRALNKATERLYSTCELITERDGRSAQTLLSQVFILKTRTKDLRTFFLTCLQLLTVEES